LLPRDPSNVKITHTVDGSRSHVMLYMMRRRSHLTHCATCGRLPPFPRTLNCCFYIMSDFCSSFRPTQLLFWRRIQLFVVVDRLSLWNHHRSRLYGQFIFFPIYSFSSSKLSRLFAILLSI